MLAGGVGTGAAGVDPPEPVDHPTVGSAAY